MFYVTFIGRNSGSYYFVEFEDFNEAVRFKQCFEVYVLLGYGSYYNTKISKKKSENHQNYGNNYSINRVYRKMKKVQERGYI